MPIAVGETGHWDTDFIQHRQMQIGQRCRFFVGNVSSAPHVARSTTGNQDGQIRMIVYVGIPHAAAVQIQTMIQQGTVAFRRCLEPLQESCKQGHMKHTCTLAESEPGAQSPQTLLPRETYLYGKRGLWTH